MRDHDPRPPTGVRHVRRSAIFLLLLVSLLGACTVGEERDSSPQTIVSGASTTESTSPDTQAQTETRQALASARCPLQKLPFSRAKLPDGFFSARASALWAPSSANRCIFLIAPGARAPRAVWQVPEGERLARLGWAPDGETFAATTLAGSEAQTYVVSRNGLVREQFTAAGVGFVSDGRELISRLSGIYLRSNGDERRVVTLGALRGAAGLGGRAIVSVGPDRYGFSRGYADQAILITASSGRDAQALTALMIVSTDGRVVRVGPTFDGDRTGVPGGYAWSPAGDTLAEIVGELPGKAGLPLPHDHCLGVWTKRGGYERVVCGSELPYGGHFDRLVWSADGDRILLNSGVVLTPTGAYVGQLTVPPLAFQLHWSEP